MVLSKGVNICYLTSLLFPRQYFILGSLTGLFYPVLKRIYALFIAIFKRFFVISSILSYFCHIWYFVVIFAPVLCLFLAFFHLIKNT